MHFICIYLLALLHIFEYTKKTELYPAIGKEELFQMLYSQNKKRGFTLVELIVVLVILAILAALLIPALTGYIDKAKKDQVIAETRMLHEAVQTEMVEIYGSNIDWKTTPTVDNGGGYGRYKTIASSTGRGIGSENSVLPDAQKRYQELVKLSEVPSLQGTNPTGKLFIAVTSNAKVHAIVYDSGRGYLGVYFRDTQQYAAYKIGEKSAGGTIQTDALGSYLGSVFYNAAFDYDPNSGTKPLPEEWLWSCSNIRAMLGIEEPSYN